MTSTAEDVKVAIVVAEGPETPPGASSTPKTPGSQLSPRSRLTSPFMQVPGMDPRDVPFWPPQRYEKEKVDFTRPPQDWDTPLLLRQVVEHKRPYPLDSVTFREYLRKFFTEENIDFLLELSRLRREILKDGNPRVKELTDFYDKYMSPTGSKSANISSAALDHVKNTLAAGEREVEIRDFHLANRDIADLLIRGPYLKDFFRSNLVNVNDNELRADVLVMIVYGAIVIVAYTMTLLQSYYWLILGLMISWLWLFMFNKWMAGICPILTLYHDGYRLRPTAQMWHCAYMNEHLQKVEDEDVLEAQRKNSKQQLLLTTVVAPLITISFALIRYFVFEN